MSRMSRQVVIVLVASSVLAQAAAHSRGQAGTVLSHVKISATSGSFAGPLDDADAFSRSLVALGDLDGDGVGEIAVGALGDDDGGADHGAVWVLFPATDGSVSAQAKISSTSGGFTGVLESGDWFGFSGALLGDLDGDGTADLAVGAPRDDDGGLNTGSVWILFLQPDGSVRTHTRISAAAGGFVGALDANDLFGTSLAALGDLDDDGKLELAVGAPGDDDGGADHGAVWILSLAADGSVAAQAKISSTQGGFGGDLDSADQFAISLASLGDLDGDGSRELAVGARADDDGGADRGAVWLLSLAANGSVAAQHKISSTQGGFAGALDDGDFFGVAVTTLGDLDQDGHTDLAVGANLDDDGGPERGAVWILFLGAGGSVLSHAKISAVSGGFTGTLDLLDDFGIALANLGDVDGDGVPDLAAGALWDDDGGTDRGAVWVLSLDAAKWLDLGGSLAGAGGPPVLSGLGTLQAGEPGALTLAGALPFRAAFLVFGFAEASAPFKGGTLVPAPQFIVPAIPLDAAGGVTLGFTWPPGVPGDFTTWLQFWVPDAAGPAGFSASNGLAAVTP